MFENQMQIMGLPIALLVLLANPLPLKCLRDTIDEDDVQTSTGNPNYSFSYGVSDINTGDVKTVWEEKDGDNVKGHYSVLEADGTVRTVEYSANPETGFMAVVNNDGEKVTDESVGIGRSMKEKAVRDYDKFYDFSENGDLDFMGGEKKRGHPFDTLFKDYPGKKRNRYTAPDLEASDFSHSITIKHPRDPTGAESESQSHSHFGLDMDPNCKKHNKELAKLYNNVVEFDPARPQDIKYPFLSTEPYKDEKFAASNIEFEKYSPYGSKIPKLDPTDYDKLLNSYAVGNKAPKLEDYDLRPSKYKYPYVPDVPPEFFEEDVPTRPKKKYKPHRNPEYQYANEELEDYWVPKKKRKPPTRFAEPPEYRPEFEDEYDRPRYPTDFEEEEQDDRPPRPPPRRPHQEVVKKIIKKRKPGFNLLDILDI